MKCESWSEEARDPPAPRDWQKPRARPGQFQAGAGSSPRVTAAQGWGRGERSSSVAKPLLSHAH